MFWIYICICIYFNLISLLKTGFSPWYSQFFLNFMIWAGWFARDPSILHRVGHVLLQAAPIVHRRARRFIFADDCFQLSKVPKQKTSYVVSKTIENLSGCKCSCFWLHYMFLKMQLLLVLIICFFGMQLLLVLIPNVVFSTYCSLELSRHNRLHHCCLGWLCRPVSKAYEYWPFYCFKCTDFEGFSWSIHKYAARDSYLEGSF